MNHKIVKAKVNRNGEQVILDGVIVPLGFVTIGTDIFSVNWAFAAFDVVNIDSIAASGFGKTFHNMTYFTDYEIVEDKE